ncbi:MAG: LD-carboxypeptidase [Oligoflexia bacterium]|nr:LD-carboxypeptidase [Oligoflexia bacterium]
MRTLPRIGIVAPSSKVPQVEFQLGIEQLRQAGFEPRIHPQCRKSHLFFAGTDEERARAFFEFAEEPALDALWCARGGYGAIRILPLLEKLEREKGRPPRKLLIGYSDATALMDFVNARWGWPVLHAPMPGIRAFCVQTAPEWKSLTDFIRGERGIAMPWGRTRLKFAGERPSEELRAPVVGGNLTVWNMLVGTPFAPRPHGKILFFEDVTEGLYRLDRMLQQLLLAGGFKGVRAIVLGNFDGCVDYVPNVLAHPPRTPKARQRMLLAPRASDLQPLRKKLPAERWIPKLFGEIGAKLGIPVAYGLPAGHGPGHASLPLSAEYRLSPLGEFELLSWDWGGWASPGR